MIFPENLLYISLYIFVTNQMIKDFIHITFPAWNISHEKRKKIEEKSKKQEHFLSFFSLKSAVDPLNLS